jgi:hypothetical protein
VKAGAAGLKRPAGLRVAVTAQLWVFISELLLLIRFLRFAVVDVEPLSTIRLLVLHYSWVFAVTLLCIPLWRRKRWAWSAFVAVFFCRAAGEFAALFILFDDLGRYRGSSGGASVVAGQMLISMIGEHVLMTLLSSCAGALLFRSADWFGVERRQAWRTTFREAWWAWVLCGVMGVVLPLVFQLARTFPHP